MRRLAEQRQRRPAHVRRRRRAVEQLRGAGLDCRGAEPRLRHRGKPALVEGAAASPSASRSVSRCSSWSPCRWCCRAGARETPGTGRPVGAPRSSGPGWSCSGRWCSCSSRPASASSTTSDPMPIRTGAGSRRAPSSPPPLAGRLAAVQALHRQLHRLQRRLWHRRRRHRRAAVVLRLQPGDSRRRRAERRNRARVPIRQAARPEERRRPAAARAARRARVPGAVRRPSDHRGFVARLRRRIGVPDHLRRRCDRRSSSARRGVAQPGRALALGARSRWFESSRPDHSALCADRSRARIARYRACHESSRPDQV